MNFINDIKKLGFFFQCTNEKLLETLIENDQKICAYIGFDCTAPSLHVGSMIQIMILRLLQKYGHKPIVILGSTTSKIGDPSGKDSMRKMLSNEEIHNNKKGIQKTLEKFIKIGNNESDAIILDNSDWLEKINYIEFLRKFGHLISVNKMLSMDSVKNRLERLEHLSFLEFNYMLFQAIDFYELNKNYNTILQIGGSDQWGNIVMGVELTNKMSKKEVIGLTTNLLTNSNGKKMGKTEQGAIWLNENMLSPYDFFQFWRNTDDQDVLKFSKYFCELSDEELKKLEYLSIENVNLAKKQMAYNITKLVHGETAANQALKSSEDIFEKGKMVDNAPKIELDFADIKLPIFKIIALSGIVSSSKKAKDLIRGSGIKINSKVVEDENMQLSDNDLNNKNQITISHGKKKFFVINFIQK